MIAISYQCHKWKCWIYQKIYTTDATRKYEQLHPKAKKNERKNLNT